VLCFFPYFACSETLGESFSEKMCKAMSANILDELKPEIQKHSHLPALDDLVYFTPTINFNAVADTEYTKVYIAGGMCHELVLMADASAIVRTAFPEKIFQLNDYAKYLASQSTDANKKAKPGEFIRFETKRFTEWAKLDLSGITSEVNSDAIEMRQVFLHDALLMVIGHELGHLINRDRHQRLDGYGELQRQGELQMARWREALADKVALKITRPFMLVDGNAGSLNALFGILNRTHTHLGAQAEQSHPPTICRIAYVMGKSGFYEELAKVNIPTKLREEMNAIVRREAAKRGITINNIADMEKLQQELLGSDACVDYWDSPLKIISAAKTKLDVSTIENVLSTDNEAALFIVTGLLGEAASLSEIKDLALPATAADCANDISGSSKVVMSGAQRFVMYCRRHPQRLTPKPIFDAVSDGRTFIAEFVDPNEKSTRTILVYGVLMRYAGIPQMVSVYYVDLDNVRASTMDATWLFSPGSSGVEIGLSK